MIELFDILQNAFQTAPFVLPFLTITDDNTARASDFINESEKDATPANDAGRVAKLESDQKIHPYFIRIGKEMNCGETVGGATTPVPVYQDTTDNELYACDASDTSKMKFIGFVITNGTDGNPARFQGTGVVSGFSGLSEGEKYYVQDTAGTIGTSAGTNEILVGIAISTSELLIQKGRRHASGTQTFDTTTTQTITVGFRVSKVNIYAVDAATDYLMVSSGGWTKYGGNKCVTAGISGSNSQDAVRNNAWYLDNTSNTMTGVIDQIDDTSFRLNNTDNGYATSNIRLYWEAEGEL